MSYVIKAAELISFLLLRHRLSTIFRARLPRDLHVSAVVNRAEHRNSSKSTTLKSNTTVQVCWSTKKICTIIQSNKKFPKTENCRTRRGTLNIACSLALLNRTWYSLYAPSLWNIVLLILLYHI